MEVRILNVLLGIWLLASALVWNEAPGQRINTCIVGLTCTGVALSALRLPAARWINMALSLWLLASLFVIPRSGEFELWNGLVAAAAMFFTSGTPSVDEELRARTVHERA